MAAPTSYAEHVPAPPLRPYIECYWTRVGHNSAEETHRVLPDGCLDIVFNFGDPPVPSSATAPDAAFVVGTMTRPLAVTPGRRVHFVGVRFRPGMARTFLRAPASELTDRAAPLDALWGRPARELQGRLADLPSPPLQLAGLERELLRRLRAAPALDAAVAAAVARIQSDRGGVSVASLAAWLNLSRQHLARRFTREVGLSPKGFCRVVRFRALLARLHRGQAVDWAGIAAELGFYDQSHLIADFREFSGLAPRQFLASP